MKIFRLPDGPFNAETRRAQSHAEGNSTYFWSQLSWWIINHASTGVVSHVFFLREVVWNPANCPFRVPLLEFDGFETS